MHHYLSHGCALKRARNGRIHGDVVRSSERVQGKPCDCVGLVVCGVCEFMSNRHLRSSTAARREPARQPCLLGIYNRVSDKFKSLVFQVSKDEFQKPLKFFCKKK